jgi:zinc/manganese transport system substrate-binding protein
VLLATTASVLALSACGPDDGSPAATPTVLVSTPVWADVVAAIVGDCAQVDLITDPDIDPHDAALSARQAAALREADLVVLSGLGLEQPYQRALNSAARDGATMITLVDADEQASSDPHVWQDPELVAQATTVIASSVAEHTGCDRADLDARAEAYAARVRAADVEAADLLADVPDGRRVLVTQHDAFGRFAERYGFDELGSVVPGTASDAAASSAHLAALVDAMNANGVGVVFAEPNSSDRLIESLGGDVDGQVEVVELFSESLGPPGSGAETYLGLLVTNAARVAEALS